MSRDDDIDRRLRRWAQTVTAGDGSGYASVNTLHPDWSPPSPGVRPGMKAGRTVSLEVRLTHRAVGELSLRLRNTVVLHYCTQLSLAEKAQRLECAESTVTARIAQAHRLLLKSLTVAYCVH